MATTHQDTNVNQLVINKMTKQEYDNLSQVSENELYLVEEQVDSTVTQGSTNPVQSGAVYEALQDIGGNINDGTTIFAKNQEIIGTTSANQSTNQTIKLPNDVVMCKMLENRALASYATPITRFKYIEDHGWVDMDRSDIQYNEGTGEWTGTFVSLDITEGEYYYDMDNKAVFVADENSEMQDVTSTVVIQDDINKLYCDVDTNMLYRYNGSSFVALTSNFSGDYNDLINNPFFVANNKLKYTDGPNTWVIPLMDDFSNNQNDYSKQILIYNGTGGIGPSMNIINHIGDNDLLDYLPANYTIQDFVKAIADYYIQYKNDLLSGHNYFSVYGKAWRIRISPPEFYNYRFDYIKYNNDYIAKIEISALDSSYSAVGWYNNTTWTFEETTLKQVAFSGSYNDLSNKPSKNYVLDTTRPLSTSENKSSDYYLFAPDIIKGEYHIVNFDMIISSTITFTTTNPIYIYYNSGTFLWIVSSGTYQAGEYHITKRITIPDTFNNPRFYITANDVSLRGIVSIKNCRIERENDNGWQPNTSDEQIYFTSDTVSGNIASGETLAVMMKKIAQNSEGWGIGSVADIESHKGFTTPHAFACNKSFSIGTSGGSLTLEGSTKGILISVGGDIIMLAVEPSGALISAYIDPNNHWQAVKKFQ